MSGGKITAYLDCGGSFLSPLMPYRANYITVSPFSYFALKHLEKHRAVLESHNVEIEYVLPLLRPQIHFPLQTHARRRAAASRPYRTDVNSIVPVFLGGIMEGSGAYLFQAERVASCAKRYCKAINLRGRCRPKLYTRPPT